MGKSEVGLTAAIGAVAQLGERELCKLEVVGSIPIGSTTLCRSRGYRWQANSLLIADKFAVTTEIMISNRRSQMRSPVLECSLTW